MNKKLIYIIIAVIVVLCVGVGLVLMNGNKQESNTTNNNNESNNNTEVNENTTNDNTNTSIEGNKILVVYYSAQNHTERVAKEVAENLNADVYEIVPKDVYTEDDLDWTNNNSRVTKEHDDESLRNIELVSTKVDNWDSYDTVLIGYPIWWGIAAWPTNTFVENNDFTGKTVIPPCTSASAGIGESGNLLAKLAGTGDWKNGQRFSSSVSESEIKTWTDSLK